MSRKINGEARIKRRNMLLPFDPVLAQSEAPDVLYPHRSYKGMDLLHFVRLLPIISIWSPSTCSWTRPTKIWFVGRPIYFPMLSCNKSNLTILVASILLYHSYEYHRPLRCTISMVSCASFCPTHRRSRPSAFFIAVYHVTKSLLLGGGEPFDLWLRG